MKIPRGSDVASSALQSACFRGGRFRQQTCRQTLTGSLVFTKSRNELNESSIVHWSSFLGAWGRRWSALSCACCRPQLKLPLGPISDKTQRAAWTRTWFCRPAYRNPVVYFRILPPQTPLPPCGGLLLSQLNYAGTNPLRLRYRWRFPVGAA